jgi:flagellar export protein FliJ
MSRSIESLLNLKRWREDEVKNLFAILLKELAIEEEKLAALEVHHDLISGKLNEGSEELVDIEEIRRLQDYSGQLVEKIQYQRTSVATAQQRVEDARAVLTEASQDRKTFERLDEKIRQTADDEQERKEQVDADERAVIQYGRNHGQDRA